MKPNRNSVTRLAQYKNILQRIKSMGFEKVFSDNLADAVGVTSSQVRKDFSLFGVSGNKRGGFIVDDLVDKINGLLGKNTLQKVIIVGVGNIGRALMRYREFEKEGIRIVAGFDTDPAKQDPAAELPVFPLDQVVPFANAQDIRIGIICVPETAAQNVLNLLLETPVQGVLNFAPIRLIPRRECVIHNVNVGVELESVIYFVNALNRKGP